MEDLVLGRTDLQAADLDWLHRLVGEWQLLADLSFADLLLWVPIRGGGRFVAAAQMRPSTGPTSYVEDEVGTEITAAARPQLAAAYAEGRILRETDPDWASGVPVREEAIPVRRGDAVIAVIARETNLVAARTPSRLELAYLEIAGDLAQMVAEGRFPRPDVVTDLHTGPRVGDGLIRLDAAGRVVYASPNAQSAYRRLGMTGDLLGASLGAVTAELAPVSGPLDDPVAAIAAGRSAREGEVEVNGSVVQLRAIPLWRTGARIGALMLVRDVTELRRRDRELLSKDATIREIHHRVKNNLQTVAALLRLQARRVELPQARQALEESVRRVSSIAIVHETLSLTLDGSTDFDGIADRVLAMVDDVASGAAAGTDAGVRLRRTGSFGVLPAAVATPLAMVLTELLHNAVEHAFPSPPGGAGRLVGGTVEVAVRRDGRRLALDVLDDGAGLPPAFSLVRSDRLGLQIVRTLVEGEMAGTIALANRVTGGTAARVVLRLPDPAPNQPSGR